MKTNPDGTEENEVKISGELTRIIFKNDNGFLIGAFTGEEQFTATGTLINPQTGLDYALHGDWKDTPKYGRQFVFTRVETDMPVNPDGIFKYIVRICRFVGSAVGQRIVDKYGAETLDIMKSDPGRVARDISGITAARATEIQTTLLENQHRERVMVELGVILDVPGMIKKTMSMLYQDYKDQAAEAVKKNPYILTNIPWWVLLWRTGWQCKWVSPGWAFSGRWRRPCTAWGRTPAGGTPACQHPI